MEKTFEADVVSVKRSVNTKNGNPRYIVEFVGLSGLTVKFRTKDDVCFSKNLEYLAGERCRITLDRKRIRDMEKVENVTKCPECFSKGYHKMDCSRR